MYKQQNIERLVIDQAGLDKLILNDLILGNQGAHIIAALIPQYHLQLQHLQIKGNNIDSQGFQAICLALMNCPLLKSIMAQWNCIGLTPQGLVALTHLVKKASHLQIIDLKNNRLTHQAGQLIGRIIQLNSPSLKVIDLRWNQIGQIGARQIVNALPSNNALKYIGLQDNRISLKTVMEIQQILRVQGRTKGSLIPRRQQMNSNYYHLSQQEYPSMQVQLKTAQLRTKIQNQHRQAEIYNSKIQSQIQKVLQKINFKGKQINQSQIKMDSLISQNNTLLNQLRQAQRLIGLEKQRLFGQEKELNQEKSRIRQQKYKVNLSIKNMMEKYTQRNEAELNELQSIMALKFDKLQSFFKQRMNQKRRNYQKLSDLKQDILKFKMSKELIWDKVTSSTMTGKKSAYEDQCIGLQQLIAKAQSISKNQEKKGKYMSEQLSSLVVRGLQNQEKLQGQIFQIKEKIKALHHKMTQSNIDIESNYSKHKLLQNKCRQFESGVQLRRRYARYIQSQNSVNCDIQKMKQVQKVKADRVEDEMIEKRICDVQLSLRSQQSHNKMLKNQYQKLMSVVENTAKSAIQKVLFDN